ncbi:Conserved_hypothetical protein [Hexamita inflata]|uniref:Uncharacterized protein n=1 Tax=Hexamita inflata TaxID=28002 RepID=A0ABP1GHD9_9EUKA
MMLHTGVGSQIIQIVHIFHFYFYGQLIHISTIAIRYQSNSSRNLQILNLLTESQISIFLYYRSILFTTPRLELQHKIITTEPKEIFDAFGEIPCRKNIWLLVSDYYGCIPQEAHDYYHNVWSKQFCEALARFKPELDALAAERFEPDRDPKETGREVIAAFVERHPDKHFHRLSVSQYVHKQLKAIQKEKSLESGQSSDTSEKQKDNVVSDLIALLSRKM